jgi:hypothetical protein
VQHDSFRGVSFDVDGPSKSLVVLNVTQGSDGRDYVALWAGEGPRRCLLHTWALDDVHRDPSVLLDLSTATSNVSTATVLTLVGIQMALDLQGPHGPQGVPRDLHERTRTPGDGSWQL